jgi:tRNA threonylcarbamoyladenosine biosynthesis protein TsaE
MAQFTTHSVSETEHLGARLAAVLRSGDVVTVAGELGTGKTCLIRGACAALGVTAAVTSPTFALGHLYEAATPVAHLDLYRLAPASEEGWAELEPYFDGTIAFVEWPEHAGAWLPTPRMRAVLTHIDEWRREITIGDGDDLRL